MHAAPADLALGGKAFAVVGGDARGLGKSGGDFAGVLGGSGGPVVNTARGINADNAVGADAVGAEFLRDGTGFADLGKIAPPVILGTHRGAATGGRPNGSADGADEEPAPVHFVGEAENGVIVGINVKVRRTQVHVDAVEADAIDLGARGEVEHGVEVQNRLGARGAFADDAGPHGVVQFGMVVIGGAHDGGRGCGGVAN